GVEGASRVCRRAGARSDGFSRLRRERGGARWGGPQARACQFRSDAARPADEGVWPQGDAMNARPDRRRDVAEAIFAYEIGLQFGVYGEFRLWSAYQPIFAPQGRTTLKAVAVEALIEPRRVATPVAPQVFFDSVAASGRPFVQTMCRMLHLCNYRNIAVDGL